MATSTKNSIVYLHNIFLLIFGSCPDILKIICAKIKCSDTNTKIVTVEINQCQQAYSYETIAPVQHLGKHSIYIYIYIGLQKDITHLTVP